MAEETKYSLLKEVVFLALFYQLNLTFFFYFPLVQVSDIKYASIGLLRYIEFSDYINSCKGEVDFAKQVTNLLGVYRNAVFLKIQ